MKPADAKPLPIEDKLITAWCVVVASMMADDRLAVKVAGAELFLEGLHYNLKLAELSLTLQRSDNGPTTAAEIQEQRAEIEDPEIRRLLMEARGASCRRARNACHTVGVLRKG